MADRPIFLPSQRADRLVEEICLSFQWHPGLAASQKKKNVAALHAAAANRGISPVLEVSTKSEELLGQRLSAFNLKVELDEGAVIPLECAFQGSKVFRDGGPFSDLYWGESRAAKRDERLSTSGPLVAFSFDGQQFPLEPKTAFYDWLYLRALYPHREFLRRLDRYEAFSDIEFNPEKSINCQARSCALFVSLSRRSLLDQCARSSTFFIQTLFPDAVQQPHSDKDRQSRMF